LRVYREDAFPDIDLVYYNIPIVKFSNRPIGPRSGCRLDIVVSVLKGDVKLQLTN